jgi:hypothetical protein
MNLHFLNKNCGFSFEHKRDLEIDSVSIFRLRWYEEIPNSDGPLIMEAGRGETRHPPIGNIKNMYMYISGNVC